MEVCYLVRSLMNQDSTFVMLIEDKPHEATDKSCQRRIQKAVDGDIIKYISIPNQRPQKSLRTIRKKPTWKESIST